MSRTDKQTKQNKNKVGQAIHKATTRTPAIQQQEQQRDKIS